MVVHCLSLEHTSRNCEAGEHGTVLPYYPSVSCIKASLSCVGLEQTNIKLTRQFHSSSEISSVPVANKYKLKL